MRMGLLDTFKKKTLPPLTPEEARIILDNYEKENEDLLEKLDLLEEEINDIDEENDGPLCEESITYLSKMLDIAREYFDNCDNSDFEMAVKTLGCTHQPATFYAQILTRYARALQINYSDEDDPEEIMDRAEELVEDYPIGTLYKPEILFNLKSFYAFEGDMDKVSEILPKLKKAEENFKEKYNDELEEVDAKTDSFEKKTESIKNIMTERGHPVCSMGEKKIADFLFTHGIDYDYDKQITLRGNEKNKNGYDTSWCRPDFYLNEFNVIIEYLGMVGASDYDENMEKKKRLYKEAMVPFISIEPKDLGDIESILTTKLRRFGVDL